MRCLPNLPPPTYPAPSAPSHELHTPPPSQLMMDSTGALRQETRGRLPCLGSLVILIFLTEGGGGDTGGLEQSCLQGEGQPLPRRAQPISTPPLLYYLLPPNAAMRINYNICFCLLFLPRPTQPAARAHNPRVSFFLALPSASLPRMVRETPRGAPHPARPPHTPNPQRDGSGQLVLRRGGCDAPAELRHPLVCALSK